MSARARLIIAVLVGLVLALALFFFLIRPRQGELGEIREQIEAEEQRTLSLQAELSKLRALQANEPQLRAELAELREFVPRHHQIPNFIFQVQNAANRSGVSFLQITPELPKEPPEGAALAEVRIQLGASGGYFAIQDFLRRLYALDRALRIDLLQMTGGTDEDGALRISVQTTSRIFFDLPTAAVGGTGTTTGTASEPPAVTPTPTPTDATEDEEAEG